MSINLNKFLLAFKIVELFTKKIISTISIDDDWGYITFVANSTDDYIYFNFEYDCEIKIIENLPEKNARKKEKVDIPNQRLLPEFFGDENNIKAEIEVDEEVKQPREQNIVQRPNKPQAILGSEKDQGREADYDDNREVYFNDPYEDEDEDNANQRRGKEYVFEEELKDNEFF